MRVWLHHALIVNRAKQLLWVTKCAMWHGCAADLICKADKQEQVSLGDQAATCDAQAGSSVPSQPAPKKESTCVLAFLERPERARTSDQGLAR